MVSAPDADLQEAIMRILLLAFGILAAAMTVSAGRAQNAPGPTLSNVLKKGFVECAVPSNIPGFG